MGKDIRISVVIPVYNVQKHLSQCLESVLKQDIPGIEIICVDDGSTDGSVDILKRYAASDDRIHVICQKNQYAGIARNHGMQQAKGEYLAFLDADDFYLPGALKGLYDKAQKYRLDFVKGQFIYLDEQTGCRFLTSFSRNGGVPKHRVITFWKRPVRLLHAADVPWNGLYRRAFLEKHGICFNHLRCINDHSFYIQCLIHAERLLFSHDMVACYRVNQSDSLVGQKAMHFDAQLENYQIVHELCNDVEPIFARQILRCELNGVFEWYTRLAGPVQLQGQLKRFLQGLDENDVGKEYLQSFPFQGVYYGLRYGSLPPGKRPILPARLVNCWKEHGWRYTWERLLVRYQADRGR